MQKKAKAKLKANPRPTNNVNEEENSLQCDKKFYVFQVTKPKSTPLIKVEIIIDGTLVNMEVDTGAFISLLNLQGCENQGKGIITHLE